MLCQIESMRRASDQRGNDFNWGTWGQIDVHVCCKCRTWCRLTKSTSRCQWNLMSTYRVHINKPMGCILFIRSHNVAHPTVKNSNESLLHTITKTFPNRTALNIANELGRNEKWVRRWWKQTHFKNLEATPNSSPDQPFTSRVRRDLKGVVKTTTGVKRKRSVRAEATKKDEWCGSRPKVAIQSIDHLYCCW